MPPPKKTKAKPQASPGLIYEVSRRIRLARTYWHGGHDLACRGERKRAWALYEKLGEKERERVPHLLRVWLRLRSRRGFGLERTGPGGGM